MEILNSINRNITKLQKKSENIFQEEENILVTTNDENSDKYGTKLIKKNEITKEGNLFIEHIFD